MPPSTVAGAMCFPRLLAFLFILSTFACRSPAATPCGTGFCAANQVCNEPTLRCEDPDLLRACDGIPALGDCVEPGGLSGTCRDGVCVRWSCGNGYLEGSEICDDGNRAAGDGCDGECRSDETCGNGVIDVANGEECDCGRDEPINCNQANSDQPGAACREDCTAATCGDGIVDPVEECEAGVVPVSCVDAGYYEGATNCLPECRVDLSGCRGFCGDGIVNGVEDCDSSPTATCFELGFDVGRVQCSTECGIDSSDCGTVGWNVLATIPGLSSAYALDDDSVLVGTVAGEVLIASDDGVRRLGDAVRGRMVAVWADPAKRLFALGESGIYSYRVESDEWTAEPVEGGIWGFAPIGRESAVAYASVNASFVAYYYAGDRWVVASDTRFGPGRYWGRGPDDFFSVLSDSLYRFDGTRLTEVLTFPEAAFRDVWGRSNEEVYIVGDRGLFARFDGSAPRRVPVETTANLDSIDGSAHSIIATGGDAVFHDVDAGFRRVDFGSGDISTVAGGGTRWLIDYDTGRVFAQSHRGSWAYTESTPSTVLEGRSPEQIFGIASDGRIEQLEASGWRPRLARAQDIANFRTGALIVGDDRGITYLRPDMGVLGFPSRIDSVLEHVWASPEGDVFATVDRRVHRVPANGPEVLDELSQRIVELDGSSTDNVFAIGDSAVWRYDGAAWSREPVTPNTVLRDVWVSDAGDAFVVGDDGTILRRSEGTWTALELPGKPDLIDVSGSSSTDVVAISREGAWYFDGTAWTRLRFDNSDGLGAVWVGEREVLFATEGERVLHWLRPPATRVRAIAP